MKHKIILTISILALLAIGILFFGFLRYQPALLAAPGYTLDNITDPGWLNARIKTIQAITEQVPCTYTLLGWQEDENFYYQSSCDEESQLWRYMVSTDESEKVEVLPNDLFAVPIPISTIEDGLLANVYPQELATVSRQTFIAGEPLASANGRYTALVSQHVYGPQDVLLMTVKP